MKEKIKYLMSKKSFHISMIIIIIAVILFTLGIIVLRYQVEGETNMPFSLTKVILISSQEGIDKESGENRWGYDINQNNDIYLYLEKNKNFQEEAVIKSILIDNIQVEKSNDIGEIKFYRPNVSEEGTTFSNTQENQVQNIEYEGAMESDLKNLKIGNQGGIVVFRCANEKVAEYFSNDEEINHSELLKKANISEENLKSKISFDLTIKTEEEKGYKASLAFELPIEGIVEQGTTSKEITDLQEIVFKRTKN